MVPVGDTAAEAEDCPQAQGNAELTNMKWRSVEVRSGNIISRQQTLTE